MEVRLLDHLGGEGAVIAYACGIVHADGVHVQVVIVDFGGFIELQAVVMPVERSETGLHNRTVIAVFQIADLQHGDLVDGVISFLVQQPAFGNGVGVVRRV